MNRTQKRALLLLSLLFLLVVSAFGQDLAVLNETATKVQDLFSSTLVKTVLTIALGGLALGLILNKDNDAMKKRFIVWLVAVAILRGMTEIVPFFFGS